jgi:S1 RNA binding domain/Nuclease-related domain
MGLMDRFRAIQAARRIHPPDPGEESGDAGEMDVLREVRASAGAGSEFRWYHSPRVPRPEGNGKYELDLLAASPFGLLGLEVKNWGGQVEQQGAGRWAWVNSRGAMQLPVDDPLDLVQIKMQAVGAYLAANGVVVPPQTLGHAVVLNNPRLQVGPQLAQRPHLLRRTDVQPLVRWHLFPNRTGAWPALRRWMGLEKTTTPAFADFAEMVRVLDRLPTWDALALHGGQVLKGDIAGPGVQLAAGKRLTRRDAREVRFHIPRSWIFGWFFAPAASWTDAAGAWRRELLAPGQVLTIRLAGRKKEQEVPIEHIETVVFGWEDASYYHPTKPDLSHYLPGASYVGKVVGVQEYGIFVDLDGRRDGLVHVSLLNRRRRTPADYERGQAVRVRVLRTKVQNGKEMIDLDLEEG